MTGGTTVVIVSWRTALDAVRAARALLDDGVPAPRLVIVDDGSGEEELRRLRAGLPAECRVLALERNRGYARACNAGAAALPARDAYLFVNPDAWVHRPGSVAALLRALREDRVAIAVPRLLNPDLTLQPSVVPFPSPLPALVQASGLSRHVPDRWQPTLGMHWSHDRTRAVQSAAGAVVAIRAAAWTTLGGFDERRFMYVEDHDLCRRAHGAGLRTVFVADAEFVHVGGASANRRWSPAARARRVARAEAEVLGDHLGRLPRAVTLVLLCAGAGGRAFVHARRGDRVRAATQRAWLRGYLEGWRSG